MFAKLFERFHITPAIAWSIGGTLLSGLTGPLVALLIAQKFSPEMQGYYYTFNSLLAMWVFLELGFNTCIVQFISHEYAHLGMEDGKLKNNSDRILGRLASLTRLSLKWYLVAAILLFIGVGLGGEMFFRHNQGNELVNWRGAWWCLCALSATNLLVLPLSALIEGCDQMDWAARARLFQNIGKSSILIGGIVFGWGLYAPAAATLCALIIYLWVFSARWKSLIKQLLTCSIIEKVSWTSEILPMQWRIAISWASGYFIFSLFGPLLFVYSGPKVAGQFGMTWAILSGISSITQSFVNTRAPRFAALIARKEWLQLRSLWRTALLQAVGLNLIGVITFITIVQGLAFIGHPMRDRLSGLAVIVIFCLANLINQFVFTVAVVARAEKKEPFLGISVITAITIAACSYLSVEKFSVIGLAYTYLLGTFVGGIGAYLVFRRTPIIRFN